MFLLNYHTPKEAVGLRNGLKVLSRLKPSKDKDNNRHYID